MSISGSTTVVGVGLVLPEEAASPSGVDWKIKRK